MSIIAMAVGQEQCSGTLTTVGIKHRGGHRLSSWSSLKRSFSHRAELYKGATSGSSPDGGILFPSREGDGLEVTVENP